MAERLRKLREASAYSEAGWFSDENNKENHPGCVRFGGFAIFFDDAATPPCGDARRGLSPDSDLFTASMTAPTVRAASKSYNLEVVSARTGVTMGAPNETNCELKI